MADEYSTKPTIKKASPPTQYKKPSPKHKFEGHEELIRSFIFLHDNKHIVSGSRDGTMRKWDCNTGLLVGEPWKEEGGALRAILALALSPNGNIIACGRDDGSVQQWDTDGYMIKGVWMGHSNTVRSLSWSPSGAHIASGSYDGTILIRKAENGTVEVGPIKTGQGWVCSLAYSPSGDRIASGGDNHTICIWDSNTGKLLVSPIKDLGAYVTSVVWSSDSSKLYSASDKFARVFDSVSGTELHRFGHNNVLHTIALSPKHNVLACVGNGSVAQLWDTESYQPPCKPFSPEDSVNLFCVLFSRDGRYLAYSGNDKKVTLWIVEDIAPQLALPAPTTQEETLPEPAPLSYLDVSTLTFQNFTPCLAHRSITGQCYKSVCTIWSQ